MKRKNGAVFTIGFGKSSSDGWDGNDLNVFHTCDFTALCFLFNLGLFLFLFFPLYFSIFPSSIWAFFLNANMDILYCI
jgi:hypothetical protein